MDIHRIDWEDFTSLPCLLANPRLPRSEVEAASQFLLGHSEFRGHLALATSGSSTKSGRKWALLSKTAILKSAQAVNSHLQSRRADRWLLALPTFHVGGLSIYARAHLTGGEVIPMPMAFSAWDPFSFLETVEKRGVTLISLVPTQLYDVVACRLSAPRSVRALIIGGAALPEALYRGACDLGWPILPSYGMTECASQIATGRLEYAGSEELPPLELLTHIEARSNEEDRLSFRGPSLLSAYLHEEEPERFTVTNPKAADGWFASDDRGRVLGNQLIPLGRADEKVKVSGESVDLARLNRIWEGILAERGVPLAGCLLALPDVRLGHVVSLVYEEAQEGQLLNAMASFNENVMPFERIRAQRRVVELPRSPLGKILRSNLIRVVGPQMGA